MHAICLAPTPLCAVAPAHEQYAFARNRMRCSTALPRRARGRYKERGDEERPVGEGSKLDGRRVVLHHVRQVLLKLGHLLLALGHVVLLQCTAIPPARHHPPHANPGLDAHLLG